MFACACSSWPGPAGGPPGRVSVRLTFPVAILFALLLGLAPSKLSLPCPCSSLCLLPFLVSPLVLFCCFTLPVSSAFCGFRKSAPCAFARWGCHPPIFFPCLCAAPLSLACPWRGSFIIFPFSALPAFFGSLPLPLRLSVASCSPPQFLWFLFRAGCRPTAHRLLFSLRFVVSALLVVAASCRPPRIGLCFAGVVGLLLDFPSFFSAFCFCAALAAPRGLSRLASAPAPSLCYPVIGALPLDFLCSRTAFSYCTPVGSWLAGAAACPPPLVCGLQVWSLCRCFIEA